jgi:hydroxymethylpyrimidine pyrophosphatase-like HAD family hydrolase
VIWRFPDRKPSQLNRPRQRRRASHWSGSISSRGECHHVTMMEESVHSPPRFDPSDVPCRAVVTDLDGTVVPSGDLITPGTLAAAGRLRALGIPLVAVTARTPVGVSRLGPFADHLALAVGNGGARGWIPATGETLWQEFMAAADLRALADFIRVLPGAGMSVFGLHAWKMTPTFLALLGGPPRESWQLVELDALVDAPAYAGSIRHATLSSDDLISMLTAAGLSTRVNLSYSADRLVDIGPLGIDKATGARRALAVLGRAPDEAIAFGDMPNDLPMFACCGRSVAVGNAHPAVRAAATFTTAAAADDGFVQGLALLGLINPSVPERPDSLRRNTMHPC